MSLPMQLHTYLLFDSPPNYFFFLFFFSVRLLGSSSGSSSWSPILNPLLPLLNPLLPNFVLFYIPLLLVLLLEHTIYNRKTFTEKHYLVDYNIKYYIPFSLWCCLKLECFICLRIFPPSSSSSLSENKIKG